MKNRLSKANKVIMSKKDETKKERNYRIATITLSVICIILVAALATVSIMLVHALRSNSCSSEIGDSTSEETSEVAPAIFTISDSENEDWSEASDLNIFYNEEFEDSTVAPGTVGSYWFTINNQTEQTLSFTVSLSEDNEYDIAIKYRLSRDGLLVVDNWSRVSEFKCSGLTINPYSSSTFTLEWWWDLYVSDENDTLAGINSEIYTLSISFSATSL